MSVVVVRHAHVGDRRQWSDDDRLRPLSALGRRQAQGLIKSLGAHSPQRMLSRPYPRCLQTLIPWAQWLGARVELVGELAEGSGPQALALIRSLAADKAAVCTHGDMIAEALAVLADEDHLDFGLHPR